MELQKKILNQFFELYQRPSLKQMSHMTGIQLTRIHRLYKGSAMKLVEYEVIRSLVQQKKQHRTQLTRLAETCESSLSLVGIRELEQLMEYKLRLWKLYNQN